MDKKCTSCGGTGRRLQPFPCGKTMSMMVLPCSACGGKGTKEE